MTQSTIACIQLSGNNQEAENLARAEVLIRQAVDHGAACVMTPECVAMMSPSFRATRAAAAAERDHGALEAFRGMAARYQTWLLIGSLVIRDEGSDRLYNRSFLLDASGNIAARYDKIHLFDATVGRTRYRESEHYHAGQQAVVTDTPFGRLGMSICYDLRFPQLYRHLAQAGAELLAVPAAFTRITGEAHWHVLLRARAIENGCYVCAPAQTGIHPGKRETYGHSLIVGPWGEVLADAGEAKNTVIMHPVDLAEIRRRRRALPSLEHDRSFR